MNAKIIKSNKDLAINGAPPAFEQPLHVGRPNIGDRKAFLKYANDIFDSHWLSNNGPLVQQLEQRIADYHQVKHCIAMCNGTVALEIAIRALGLEGEVIIPSYTFVATAHALHWQAITPVFADIDLLTHNLSPESVRSMITPRTTGIIGVHLWGRPAPVEELQQIANEHNLKLMFDAAHAFGCSHQDTMIGNFGDAEVLSFHATKFFNTFEGGAVLTNNDDLADAMRLMRNFGFSGMDTVIYPGTNGKMIEMAAAMGLVNLDSITNVVDINYQNYQIYQKELDDIPGINLLSYNETEKNNFQYIVVEIGENCAATRGQIIEALQAENVRARRYFWPGCHEMKPYKDLFPHSGLLLENTISIAKKVVVLPTGTMVNEKAIHTIAQTIKAVVKQSL